MYHLLLVVAVFLLRLRQEHRLKRPLPVLLKRLGYLVVVLGGRSAFGNRVFFAFGGR